MIDIIHIPTYAERASDGRWDLFVTCPHCGAIHRHGGGAGRLPSLGHRVGHCVGRDRAGDYILVAGPVDMARPRAGRGKRAEAPQVRAARLNPGVVV